MKAIAYIAAVLALGGVGCSNDDDDDQGVPPPGSTTTRAVTQTDIVSDENDALVTDPQLVNAWGLAFNPVGAAWVSATETGVSTVYDGQGNALIPAVTIPDEEGEPGSPTGQVFNADEDAFEGNVFIFVTEDGTIAGWEPAFGDVAELHVDNSRDDANYKVIVVVFTDLRADRAQGVFDDVLQQLAVPSYLEDGIVFGPFYEGNTGTAIYNAGFRPFQSPVPFLFVRQGVISDWKFFLDKQDWLDCWAHRFGESAVHALAEELRRLPWRARRDEV